MSNKNTEQVKITDKTDKCYGMVGDVFDVDQSRLSGHDRYYIQIKGYDNCIKAGYTPEDIKKKRLDEVGFHRIVDADKCEVVYKEIEEYENTHPIDELSSDDEECLEAMSKQELIELVQSLRSELADAQETIEYLNDTIDDIHEREMDELCEG